MSILIVQKLPRKLIEFTVSEPIGLEIVSFNGGSYTGAILFVGFMYISAAGVLWLVRAWKIGDLEKKAAVAHKDARNIDPMIQENSGEQTAATVDVKITPFMERLFMWRKV